MTINQPAPSAQDILGGGASGPPSVKFPTVGTTFTGTAISEEVQQQRDFTTGDLQFWNDGKPKWQVVLTCSDADGELHRLFFKSQMLTAAKAALRDLGMASFEPGCKVTVTFTGYNAVNTRAKDYSVQISKGSVIDIATEPAAPAAPAAEAPVVSPEQVQSLGAEAQDALRAAGLIK
jgi:hypothetical protein